MPALFQEHMTNSSLSQAPFPIPCCPSYTCTTVWKTKLPLPIPHGLCHEMRAHSHPPRCSPPSGIHLSSCPSSSVSIATAMAQTAPNPLSLWNSGCSLLGSPPLSAHLTLILQVHSDFSQLTNMPQHVRGHVWVHIYIGWTWTWIWAEYQLLNIFNIFHRHEPVSQWAHVYACVPKFLMTIDLTMGPIMN